MSLGKERTYRKTLFISRRRVKTHVFVFSHASIFCIIYHYGICPIHSSLLLLVYERIFGLPYSSCNSFIVSYFKLLCFSVI